MSELDARTITGGSAFEADVCIVGAGPAGIILAREFIGRNVQVIVLESGGRQPEESPQDLNDGAVVGDSYSGLRRTRYRAVGGTAHLWNTHVAGEAYAKYVPLDECDVDRRPDAAHEAWAFDYKELEPFYRRAQTLCGLGPFVYDSRYWSDPGPPGLPLDSDHLRNRVYQCGIGRLFTDVYPREVLRSANVALCHHATVCRLEPPGADRRLLEATAATPSGGRFRVRAAIFVLAGGAIENARLLLVSEHGRYGALGNRHGWVGRCFMEHPRDHALTLLLRRPALVRDVSFYDVHPAVDGTIVAGRIALDQETIRTHTLPNASMTLRPDTKGRPPPPSLGARFMARLRQRQLKRHDVTYGWSAFAAAPPVVDAFHVLVNIEQRPHPENRVVLATSRDHLKVPRIRLHWRWRREEQANLERLRTVLAAALEAAGLGRVEVRRGLAPDPNAHHHAGTTRMHADPRWGVVDTDGRLHDADNVYVTGGSVLPTAGFANPTLTIVALALRLADHLRRRI
jgi:choline dehydrogenase-like flavoprotein